MNRNERSKSEREGKIIPINGGSNNPLSIELRNAYICPKCNHVTIVCHVDPVTIPTPAFIQCKNPNMGCTATAVSCFYQIPPNLMMETNDGDFKATHEWYLPGPVEINMLPPKDHEYAKKGGLFLRERTSAEAIEQKLIVGQDGKMTIE